MADTKLSALPELSVPTLDDAIYVLDDPAGTPVDGRLPIGRVLGLSRLIPQGRLTLNPGQPVPLYGASGSPDIYYTPYFGNQIVLYDGTRWKVMTCPEITVSLVLPAAGIVANVFAYDNAGTVALEVTPWQNAPVTITIATPGVVTWNTHGLTAGDTVVFTSTGALPTGVIAGVTYFVTSAFANTFQLTNTLGGASVATSGTQSGVHTAYVNGAGSFSQTDPRNLARQDGVPVKLGDPTRRWLGVVRASGINTVDDDDPRRYLWNTYNQVGRRLYKLDNTASWTYALTAWRQGRGASQNRVDIVAGDVGQVIDLSVQCCAMGQQVGGAVAIGVDNTTVRAPASVGNVSPVVLSAVNATGIAACRYTDTVALGAHGFFWLESCSSAATVTFYGGAAHPGPALLFGVWMC